MNEKLVIDMKDGAKSGEIKIKHKGPPEQFFNLFGIKARARGIGNAPTLEMNQTSFMGNVIKEGNIDISEWKPSTKKRFVNARVKEIIEEMEDASKEQKQEFQKEIEQLKAI